MQRRDTLRTTGAGLAVVVLALAGTGPAQAQIVEVIQDTRFARTMGSDSDMLLRYLETEHASFGQDFDAFVHHTGEHGSAHAAQQWSLHTSDSSFELNATLWGQAGLDALGPGIAETHYADMLMDVTLANDVPIAYEVMVELTTQGQAHVYFRGLDLSEVQPGVYEGTGTLEPGEHRLRSWGYASTMLEDLFDAEQLLDPSVLVEGGSVMAQLSIRGHAVGGHVIPAPAAVGPGLVLLGMMLMQRWRGLGHNSA